MEKKEVNRQRYKKLEKKLQIVNKYKMGYPSSVGGVLYVQFTEEGVNVKKEAQEGYIAYLDHSNLGIIPESLAGITINNMGSPFSQSKTRKMECKEYEQEVIHILSRYFGLSEESGMGYITNGSTEGNFVSLWWSKRKLLNSNSTNQINNNKRATKECFLLSSEMAHYSIDKIADQLSLQLKKVKCNSDYAMDLIDFERVLKECLKEEPKNNVIMVNATIGTTVHGGIDDVPSIHRILQSYLDENRFTIHMDAALLAFSLPITKPFGNVNNYFEEIGVSTIAICGHKFLGLPQVCGVALTTSEFLQSVFSGKIKTIPYLGDVEDISFSGSRGGFMALSFHSLLHSLDVPSTSLRLKKIVHQNLINAEYLKERLINDLFSSNDIKWNRNQFSVVFPRPSDWVMKKYHLMPAPNNFCSACVLLNVTKDLIDELISDLLEEKKQRKGFSFSLNVEENFHIWTSIKLLEEKDLLDEHGYENGEEKDSVLSLIRNEFGQNNGRSEGSPQMIIERIIRESSRAGLSFIAKQGSRIVNVMIVEDPEMPYLTESDRDRKLIEEFILLQSEITYLSSSSFGEFSHANLSIFVNRNVNNNIVFDVSGKTFSLLVRSLKEKGFHWIIGKKSNLIVDHLFHQHCNDEKLLNNDQGRKGKIIMADISAIEIPPKKKEIARPQQPLSLSLDEKNVKYFILNKEHVGQAIELLTDIFCRHGVFAKLMGITKEDYRSFARQRVQKAAKDGLSSVASLNGRLIGLCISEDNTNPLVFTEKIDARLEIVSSFLSWCKDKLFESCIAHCLFGREGITTPCSMFNILFLATVDEYTSSGVAKEITNHNTLLYFSKGFGLVSAFMTHAHSRAIGTGEGIHFNVAFREYVYTNYVASNGDQPFKLLKGSAFGFLMKPNPVNTLRYRDRCEDEDLVTSSAHLTTKTKLTPKL